MFANLNALFYIMNRFFIRSLSKVLIFPFVSYFNTSTIEDKFAVVSHNIQKRCHIMDTELHFETLGGNQKRIYDTIKLVALDNSMKTSYSTV